MFHSRWLELGEHIFGKNLNSKPLEFVILKLQNCSKKHLERKEPKSSICERAKSASSILKSYLDVSLNGGTPFHTPTWSIFSRKKPMGFVGGLPSILGNSHFGNSRLGIPERPSILPITDPWDWYFLPTDLPYKTNQM